MCLNTITAIELLQNDLKVKKAFIKNPDGTLCTGIGMGKRIQIKNGWNTDPPVENYYLQTFNDHKPYLIGFHFFDISVPENIIKTFAEINTSEEIVIRTCLIGKGQYITKGIIMINNVCCDAIVTRKFKLARRMKNEIESI